MKRWSLQQSVTRSTVAVQAGVQLGQDDRRQQDPDSEMRLELKPSVRSVIIVSRVPENLTASVKTRRHQRSFVEAEMSSASQSHDVEGGACTARLKRVEELRSERVEEKPVTQELVSPVPCVRTFTPGQLPTSIEPPCRTGAGASTRRVLPVSVREEVSVSCCSARAR